MPVHYVEQLLDRCRPDYAVRFMETVKHVFEVEHVTFVIAANVEELAKAVQGAYGGTFDGSGYLERFFDITLELPAGSRKEFITKVVEQARLKPAFAKEIETGNGSPTAAEILVYMLYHSDLSLRKIKKAVKHLSIALLINREKLDQYAVTAVVLCALRFAAKEAYEKLDRGHEGYSKAWHILLSKLGKIEATDRHVIAMVGDILYWCARDAEDELRGEEGPRQVESSEIDAVDPRENSDSARRLERRTLTSYRAAKEAIEMVRE